jgi:hypothetical protein
MVLRQVFTAILLASAMAGFSQQFQGGVIGGLNAARIDGDGHELYGKLGLNVGAFIAREILQDQLFWQLEVKYTSRGKYNVQRDPSGFILEVNLIDLRYVELPLSLHYIYNEKLQVELGLSPDILLKERYEIDYDPVQFSNDLDRIGITAMVGINYFIIEDLAVGMRFNYSAFPFSRFPDWRDAIRYRYTGWFHDVLSLNARYYISRR